VTPATIRDLYNFFIDNPSVTVITGAGCSTDSGIPDYRDKEGNWKTKQPVYHRDFLRSEHHRKRYWARSMVGWQHFGKATPNLAHRALARLETLGKIQAIITQNVDGLHQRAGSQSVIDLHGRLDTVICLSCQTLIARQSLQERLISTNPNWLQYEAKQAPDGDAQLEVDHFHQFNIPECQSCGGILKPNVVFYGDGVAKEVVQCCFDAVNQSKAVLVVGSSLMVRSAYRYVLHAHENNIPVAALNEGKTRADELLHFKLEENCSAALTSLVEMLAEQKTDQ
jgi:NAD-dependent SIR2 family protein deacetylase